MKVGRNNCKKSRLLKKKLKRVIAIYSAQSFPKTAIKKVIYRIKICPKLHYKKATTIANTEV